MYIFPDPCHGPGPGPMGPPWAGAAGPGGPGPRRGPGGGHRGAQPMGGPGPMAWAAECIRRPNAFRGSMHSEAVCIQRQYASRPPNASRQA